MVTPGVHFIAERLHFFAAPFVLAYAVRYALAAYLQVTVPHVFLIFATFVTLFAFLVLGVKWKNYVVRRRCKELDADRLQQWDGKWPGNIDIILLMLKRFEIGYPSEGFPELLDRFGNAFRFYMMGETQILTTEPEHVKAVLATEFPNFQKGTTFFEMMKSVLGVGVFNSDGEMWKFHRSMTRPFFSKDRISHFDIFGKHADEAMELMKERFHAGYAVDFQDLASRFTMDSASEFLFGTCVDSLHAGLPYPHNAPSYLSARPPNSAEKFAQAFQAAQEIASLRSRMPLWQLAETFHDKSAKSMKVVNAYIEPIVSKAIEKKKASGVASKSLEGAELDTVREDETLLDHLVNYTEDPIILKDETLNIMIAGRDTTASALSSAIYLLSMHPEVLVRLRKEILTVVGPHRRPTYEDIKDMKYLRAFINETLRLYPPVPFDIRESINETTLAPITPGGKPVYVPPKTGVTYCVMLMHRRKDLWGPDADDFDPDRFLDYRLHKYLIPNPFIFLPFNAGPRICLGQQFAYNETSFMIIRLLQSFSTISFAEDAQPPEGKPPAYWANERGRQANEKIMLKNHLTMYAKGGVWVRMCEAPVDEVVEKL